MDPGVEVLYILCVLSGVLVAVEAVSCCFPD